MDIWQYSFTEQIPGIEGETDMNMFFMPLPQDVDSPDETTESSAPTN